MSFSGTDMPSDNTIMGTPNNGPSGPTILVNPIDKQPGSTILVNPIDQQSGSTVLVNPIAPQSGSTILTNPGQVGQNGLGIIANSGSNNNESSYPTGVIQNQLQQDDLLNNQQQQLQDAISQGGASAKGTVLDAQGREAQQITTSTLNQIPGALVLPDVSIGQGPGSQVDNVVSYPGGSNAVYVETKLTISDINQRTINQLTNAVNISDPDDVVVLQVTRTPTAGELANLNTALGDTVYNQVKVVSNQTDLYTLVQSSLKR